MLQLQLSRSAADVYQAAAAQAVARERDNVNIRTAKAGNRLENILCRRLPRSVANVDGYL